MRRAIAVLSLGLAAVLQGNGCAQAPAATGSAPAPSPAAAPVSGSVDKLLVVDCLLPGQVRKLGSKLTYLTPRRAVKTSAADCEIRGGEYVSYDRASYETALQVWLPQAEQGDAKSQNYVGEIYERGVGGGPDYAKAAVWYRKAADQGFGPAQINLAQLYESGLGVPKDPRAAAELYHGAFGLAGPVVVSSPEAAPPDPQAEALRKSLGALEDQLTAAEQALSRTKSGDASAERARLESQLAELRAAGTQLKQQGSQLASAAGGSDLRKLGAKLDDRVEQLQERSGGAAAGDAQSLTQDVEWLQRAIEEWRAALDRHERQQAIAVAGPTIQLIDPRLLDADDPNALPARGESQIVGLVKAPAGLDTLRVNGRDTRPDEKGIFRTAVTVPEAGVEVSILAIDRQGKRAERSFALRPNAEASAPSTPLRPPDVRFGRYHALLIGNADYAAFPDLDTPREDVRALGAVLQQRYGFEVTTLVDATREQMLQAFEAMRGQLGEDDNVLIYFAGRSMVDGPSGYWLPVDARPSQPREWISNQQLTDVLDAMSARHILVVADSGYAGALTRSAVARLDDDADAKERLAWQRKMASQRSRMLLTSGADHPVRAGGSTSVFATAFVEVLQSNRRVLEADRLASEIEALVTYASETASVEQRPEWAAMKYAGHEGGQFFFVPKS